VFLFALLFLPFASLLLLPFALLLLPLFTFGKSCSFGHKKLFILIVCGKFMAKAFNLGFVSFESNSFHKSFFHMIFYLTYWRKPNRHFFLTWQNVILPLLILIFRCLKVFNLFLGYKFKDLIESQTKYVTFGLFKASNTTIHALEKTK
jgi:hypothetical protein